MNHQIEYRISTPIALLTLIGTACVDLIQVILEWALIGVVINWLITLSGYFMLWFWLKIYGVNLFGGKNLVITFIAIILELLPGTDQGSFFSLDAFIVIRNSWKEDKKQHEKKQAEKTKIDLAVVTRARLGASRRPDFTPRKAA
ncbi:MAG: hypothetical protein V4674_01770 [Patescibacteria group bacterium]